MTATITRPRTVDERRAGIYPNSTDSKRQTAEQARRDDEAQAQAKASR